MPVVFTERYLKSPDAQPQAAPFERRDKVFRGLVLRVQPSGKRSWVFEYARHKRVTLGFVERLSVIEARARAKRVAGNVERGVDPLDGLESAGEPTQPLAAYLDGDYRKFLAAEREERNVEPTIDRIKGAFDQLLQTDLAALTPADFESWRTDRLADGIKPATVSRDLAAISGALSRAVRTGVIPDNPVHKVQKPKSDRGDAPRFLNDAEEAAFRAALLERDTAAMAARRRTIAHRLKRHTEPPKPLPHFADALTPACLVSINTGLRRGELLALRWLDVGDFTKLRVVGSSAKSGQTRYVPLNEEARTALKLWQTQSGGQGADRVFNVETSFKKAWAALMKSAKLESFRWHDMRHHFASRLVQKGVNLNTVRDLLGHASLAMTLRYAKLRDDDRQSAVDLL